MNCHLELVHEYITTMGLCFSVFDEHVRRSKVGGGNSREMDFESFLDFVLALENKDTPEGLTYLFRCLDLNGRGFLTTADIHTLFRYVIMYGLINTVLVG
jgi:Ca2+-binding EF-hand superfamily protein